MMHNLLLVLLLVLVGSGCACGGDAIADDRVARPRRREQAEDFGAALRAKMEAASRAREEERRTFLQRHNAETEKAERDAKQLRDAMVAFGLAQSPWIKTDRLRATYKAHVTQIADTIQQALVPFKDHPLISADLDPYLIAAVAWHESSWADAVLQGRQRGAHGEIGMLQILPSGVCARIPTEEGRAPDLLDTVENVQAGIRCLQMIRTDMYEGEGDVWRWLASYASGEKWPIGRAAVEGATGFRGIYDAILRARERPVG